ncbi:MAG: TIGR03560 family F420-dependent LLM class oxidoreductase [Nitrososphaeraceae archaeon]|nr:TIGR03560 family F420-dependent LLM class oxidoreductase [Nitrososphaeraceae archaeon]
MKFGLQHPNFSYDYSDQNTSRIIDTLSNLVAKAENKGFDSFWVMDHFHQISVVGKPEEPMLEGWTTISVLAGITTRIKLGTLVTGVIYRYPSVLAKIAATLDVLSKGRLFLGIGASWNEEESLAYGIGESTNNIGNNNEASPISFPSNKERLLRLEEALQIIRKMWTEEPSASFKGKYYQIHNAYCNPKPIQKPTPPILVGGSGEKRTLKIVAKYADACNLFGSAETVKKKLDILKTHCRNVNRDYDSILKTKLGVVAIDNDGLMAKKKVQQAFIGMPEAQLREFAIYGTPEDVLKQIKEFEDVGIQYLIVDLEPQREIEAVEVFADEIIKRS